MRDMSCGKEGLKALMHMFSAHLITYPATTYDWSDLKKKIDTEMQNRQCRPVVLHHENTHGISDVGLFDVLAFHIYGPLIGFRWKRFLAKKAEKMHSRVLSFLRDFIGLLSGIGRVARVINPAEMMVARVACLRSINISASHIAAWREALAVDCEWALGFEDDGLLESAEDLRLTFDFLEREGSADRKTLVNLSQSFRFSALGVQGIIPSSTVETLSEESQEAIFTSTPFTNTLCAVAISRSLLEVLVPFAERAVLSRRFRTIAIDFQLNRLFVEHSQQLDIRSVHLNPGVVRQGSIIRKKPLRDLR
jgi:hypothetical protein